MSSEITTALSTAFQAVQTDVTSIVTTALPPALGIMALMLALRVGIAFFKRSAR